MSVEIIASHHSIKLPVVGRQQDICMDGTTADNMKPLDSDQVKYFEDSILRSAGSIVSLFDES